jgi:hypothetical protein
MGYYTNYYISARYLDDSRSSSDLDEMFFSSLELSVNEDDDINWYQRVDNRYALEDGDGVKWYDHHEELIDVSKHYNDIIFILDGEGEETGDIWRKFYLNGRHHIWTVDIKRPEVNDEILEKLRS